VRKALKGEGGLSTPKKPPELSVVSEVLRTESVNVQLHQRATGAGKIIIELRILTRAMSCWISSSRSRSEFAASCVD